MKLTQLLQYYAKLSSQAAAEKIEAEQIEDNIDLPGREPGGQDCESSLTRRRRRRRKVSAQHK